MIRITGVNAAHCARSGVCVCSACCVRALGVLRSCATRAEENQREVCGHVSRVITGGRSAGGAALTATTTSARVISPLLLIPFTTSMTYRTASSVTSGGGAVSITFVSAACAGQTGRKL